MWLGVFILAANFAQQELFSIFSYVQGNLTVSKGKEMNSITLRPLITYNLMTVKLKDKTVNSNAFFVREEAREATLESYQYCTWSSLRTPWVIIKITPGGCTICISSYLLDI